MANHCCEASPPMLKPEPMDIRCQILELQGRCSNLALIFVHFTDFDVDLALCEQHLNVLPQLAVPIMNLSHSDTERLYKEARQFDEWVKERNDPKRTVRRDAAAVPAHPDDVPPHR